MISWKRSAVVALALGLMLRSHDAGAQQNAQQGQAIPSDAKAAADLVEKGKAAFTAGNMHEALRAFREAWAIARTSQIAANLGTIEGNFGQHRDAAEHLEFALAHLSSSATDAQKSAISEALSAEKQHVLTLRIRVAPIAAPISIDGKAVDTTPIPDEVYVEPGQHSVSADCQQCTAEARAVVGLAGEAVEVSFELKLAPDAAVMPAAGGEASSQSGSADAPDTRSPAILAVGSGVAILGIATGTIFSIARIGASRDAQNAREALPYNVANPCGPGTPYGAECQTLADANAAADRNRSIAVAGYITAGAATVGTLVYALWPRKHTSLHASPAISPKYAGVQAGWAW